MSGKLSHDLFSLWFQAPVVIALRSQNWAASLQAGTLNSNPELHRMVSEKTAAATESALALNAELMRNGMKSVQRFWLGRQSLSTTSRVSTGLGRSVVAKSVRPFAKRVRANAKRLGKKRR